MTPQTTDPSSLRDAGLAALRADPELAAIFIAEALDHLGTIESAILQLEHAPSDVALLNDIFRPFHTIKGNAGALGLEAIQQLAHTTESLLELARSGAMLVGADEADVILQAVDLLRSMVSDLTPRLAGQPAADLADSMVTVLEALDRLTTGVRSRPQPAAAADAEDASAESETSGQAPAADVAASVKVDTRKLDTLVDLVGELVILQSILQADPALGRRAHDGLGRSLAQLRLLTSELQRNALSLRMVPIRQTFQKMARLVRDLSRKSGKKIELMIAGENTELDRQVVEEIADPLGHMLRNSVDHGLESARDREAAGKSDTGRIALSAYHEGGAIVVALADDGAGLNTGRIHRIAIQRGLVGDADVLTPAQIHQLIFRPGFSTATEVTETSGRGVGMDVVRQNIEALRGRIDVETSTGRGTTFLIKLPLTMAIVEGLILRAGTERFVLPTYSVSESLRPAADQVHRMQGRSRVLKVRDAVLPLVDLATLLGIPCESVAPQDATVVVVEDAGRKMAVVVDELIGKQEVVVKSLGAACAGLRGVTGGAILGDGRIGLILDAADLMAMGSC